MSEIACAVCGPGCPGRCHKVGCNNDAVVFHDGHWCVEHAKSETDYFDHDRRLWLYCAGKIAACDWRNELFGTRDTDYGWTINEPRRFLGRGDGGTHPDWRYAGPFFVSCDHGCGHGSASHGCATGDRQDLLLFNSRGAYGGCIASASQAPSRAQVIEACLACIRAADVVFVWVDADFPTAHGTMTEIGYASALGKPIYAARSAAAATANLIEMWFPLSLVTFLGTHENPAAALTCALHAYGESW
jgi:hypothetical protein